MAYKLWQSFVCHGQLLLLRGCKWRKHKRVKEWLQLMGRLQYSARENKKINKLRKRSSLALEGPMRKSVSSWVMLTHPPLQFDSWAFRQISWDSKVENALLPLCTQMHFEPFLSSLHYHVD